MSLPKRGAASERSIAGKNGGPVLETRGGRAAAPGGAAPSGWSISGGGKAGGDEARPSVLVVDDDEDLLDLLRDAVAAAGFECHAAPSAERALEILSDGLSVSLVLADVRMPGMSGVELLHQLKRQDETLQVVMITGLGDLETVRECQREGAYDFLTKPFELQELTSAVKRGVEKSELLRQNERYRAGLEQMVEEQTLEILRTRDMAVLTLAKLAESRDTETGLHLERMAAYSRRLAEEITRGEGRFLVEQSFVEQIFRSSPLHDIGKVGIPDSILLKPGPLTQHEFEVMKTHTLIGGNTLRSVIEQFPGRTFLHMAMEIAYGHHEKWDGSGYPQGLSGDGIPLSARIVALADAYDAITSERPYKAACSHAEAVRRIDIDRGRHFDPLIVDAFLACHEDFRAIQEGARH